MKLLIVRTGAMGDVLHALPAVADLKHRRPDMQIDWAIDPRWAALLVGDTQPYVTKARIVPTKEWSAAPFSLATMRSVLAVRRQMRAESYDLVVDMQGTLRSAVIGRFAAAKNFCGYADPREKFAARFYKRRLARSGTHVVEMNANLLAAATGEALTPRSLELPIQRWAEEWAAREAVFARPLAVLGAGGGWGAAEVVEASGHAARMVACNVAGLIALLRRTDLFVGGDSGPTHLAAALAVPTVALFGPTDPERNGPFGPGPHRSLRDPSSTTSYKRISIPDPGLTHLPLEEVLDAIWDMAPFHAG
jgi:heptosyltransferase-1